MKRPLWRRRQEAELDEELRSHLAMATQDRIDRGEPPERAASAALREFGNPLLVRETVRDMWGWISIATFWQDLGYAFRALRRAPAFAAAAVLTLGLGIGANTAMFGIVRAVVLRPLPFADPDRLVVLNEVDLRGPGAPRGSVSWPNFHDWRRMNRTMDSMAGYHGAGFTVAASGTSLHVPGAVVSATLFTTLGVAPAVGRGFVADDEQPGADVVIVSDEFRQTHLSGIDAPVGHGLTVNGRRFTIVGVMPPRFVFPVESPAAQLWITMAEDARVEAADDSPITAQRGARFVQAVGRLRADATLAEARADLAAVATALATEYPDSNVNRSATATPQLEALVGDVRRPLWLLMAAVGCVLLIACVNLANLMTARGLARQAELALRVALGASRGRIVRLVLAEAAVLAAAGAIFGLGIAWWSIRALVPLAPHDVRGLDAVSLDLVVLIFTAATAGACAVLVGLIPAIRATRGDPRQSLSVSRTPGGAPSLRRWLNGLVVAETALGVVLLVAATLVVSGLDRLTRTDPGFDASGVVTMRVNLPDSRYTYAAQISFYDRLLPELERLHGVDGAAVVGPLPLGGSRYRISLELPGDAGDTAATRPSPGFAFASPGYFRTMRIAVRRGRDFTIADTDSAPRVAVINESFARQYFPGADPIGQRIRPMLSTTEPDAPWREVVGVVADVKQVNLLEDAGSAFYLPYAQGMIATPHIVVRGAEASEGLPEAARRVVAAADPELAVYDVKSLQDRLTSSVGGQRFTTLLLTLFAALGLLLSAVGLYGVLAYGVSQRAHEFGVRFALGANTGDIVGSVLSGALAVVGGGLLIGIAAATALGRVMASALDFVQTPGAATYALVATVFLAIGAACALTPARRAATVDPVQALRAD